MTTDILTGDVRYELSVTVRITIEDEGTLPALVGWPVSLAAEKQSEFQRHVKAGQTSDGVQGHCRQIIYSKPALVNYPLDLGEPKLRCILILKSAASNEAEVIDPENNGVENWPIDRVKWAIDKNVASS